MYQNNGLNIMITIILLLFLNQILK